MFIVYVILYTYNMWITYIIVSIYTARKIYKWNNIPKLITKSMFY